MGGLTGLGGRFRSDKAQIGAAASQFEAISEFCTVRGNAPSIMRCEARIANGD
jgi:hypothetical protein